MSEIILADRQSFLCSGCGHPHFVVQRGYDKDYNWIVTILACALCGEEIYIP